ncbi:MAG TPA: SGNH/GDSL hydrolase family protein [Candidatus Limnocylindrales bacterium]|nr:SGNH/GDSL hydrolase family protein [Candidatus Limnocylindrales bacterium]
MRTIVCFGDSNTHGVDPGTQARWPREVRWPGVLARELGDAAAVVEEGLNGRTTVWDDPYMDFRNAKPYLLPCLRSHAPVDVLVLMLGTNDLKTVFGRSAQEIAAGAGALVDLALASATGRDGGRPAVLLVAPPRLGPVSDRSELWGFGEARAKADELPRLYRTVAAMKGVAFLDAAALVEADPADGVHLGAEAHGVLGRAIAAELGALLG